MFKGKMIRAIKKYSKNRISNRGKSLIKPVCKRLTWVFIFLPFFTFAQTTIEANISKTTVAKNQSFTVQYTITGDAEDFAPPNFPAGLQVMGSPSQGSEKRNINGIRSSLIYITYTLRANDIGEFVIGPATVIANGKSFTSNSVKIKVIKPSEASQQPNSIEAKAAKFNFIQISVFPREVFVGQPITLRYKIMSRYGLYALDVVEEPELNGFAKESSLKKIEESNENIDGINYRVYTFEKSVLIAQKAQNISGESLSVELVSAVPTGRKDWFGRPEMEQVKHVVYKNLPKILVKSLPDNAPVTFGGAVGNFNLDVSLSRNELEADESATLSIKITGTGNTKFVELPKVKIPDDLETYSPKYAEKITVNSDGYKGYKKEEYLIIPRYKGTYKIPPITFTYFDTDADKYVTLQSDTKELSVLSGPDNIASSNQSGLKKGVQKDRVELMNEDILFIKTNDTELHKMEKPFYGSTTFYILLYLGLAGLAAPWVVFGVSKKLYEMGAFSKRNSIEKESKALLKLAQKEHLANNQNAVLAHLHKALQIAIGSATGLSISEVNPRSFTTTLAKKGLSESETKQIEQLWETIEMVRFAPLQKEDESELLKNIKTITQKLLDL